MSGTKKQAAATVRGHAETLVNELADLCARISIAGSLRRGARYVGDAEIVALPNDAPTLRARLDKWVATGKVSQALYGDMSMRWGEKYRGLMIEGVRFEIFLADADNWGYQLWLRTGPGDANHWVMQQLIAHQAPYRPIDGYWWEGQRKLAVPDEAELFRLLGSGRVIAPEQRSVVRYRAFLARPRWANQLIYAGVPAAAPTQGMMF